MYYEISNIVFNHKLSEHEIRHSNPFAKTIGRGKKKTKQNFFLVKDKPEKLFQFYKAGFCLKPHAFNFEKEQQPDCFVNCIVLDFDNLTKEQCDFVKSNSTYGDYSSGMKTKLKEIEGIPNAPLPAVWKYKVFFGVEKCLCTYEDVDAKFLEAVKFYNPYHNAEEVKATWIAWKKANNRKNNVTGVFQTRFNGWILPDVAMLNSYRTQITYGVDVNQAEKSKVVEDDWIYRHFPTAGAGKYPPTSKFDYEGLDWKIEESRRDVEKRNISEDAVVECEKTILANIHFPYDRFNLPISKAGFSRLLHKNHFTDLVVGSTGLTLLLSKVFKKHSKGTDLTLKLDEMKKDANLAGKCFARILAEIRKQGLTTSMKEEALQDIIRAFKEIHGQNVFTVLSKKETGAIVHEMARSFMSAWMNYQGWRFNQRLMKVNVNPKVIQARNKWRDTKDEQDRDEFFKELGKDLKARWNEAQKPEYDCPYDFHRRGFKAEVFNILMNGAIKIDNPEDFVKRLRMDIVPSTDGEYSEELLKKWHIQYKTMWNKEHPENPIGRKARHDKWSEIFKDKSQDEISDIIKNLDVSKQMKYKLRKQWTR